MALTHPSILDLVGSSGVLQFVGKSVLSAPSVNLEVMGLDGDADKIYIGFYELFNEEATSTVQNLEVGLEPNGLTSGMRQAQIIWNSSSVTANGGTNPEIANIGSLIAGIGRASGFFIFNAARSVNGTTPTGAGERNILNFCTQQGQTGAGELANIDSLTWEDNVTNLTSIRLRNVVNRLIGAGSQLTIYKLIENAVPSSGPASGVGVGGSLEYLDTQEITSGPASTLTFSGLDGDVDECYVIKFEVQVDSALASGSGHQLRLEPNGIGLDAAFNSTLSFIDIAGTVGTFAPTNEWTISRFAGGTGLILHRTCRGEITIWAKTGQMRSFMAQSGQGFDNNGVDANDNILGSGTWENTAINITSLVLRSVTASGFDVGTKAHLYRVRNDPPSGPVAGQNIGNLATVAVDAKAVAETLIYTVPLGKKLYITGAFVRSAASVSITVGAAAGLGTSGGADDGIAQQVLTDVLSAGPPEDGFLMTHSGKTQVFPAGTDIYVGIDVVATGTSQTLEFDLIGYLK